MYPAFDYLFDPVAIVLNPYESKSGHLSHTIQLIDIAVKRRTTVQYASL